MSRLNFIKKEPIVKVNRRLMINVFRKIPWLITLFRKAFLSQNTLDSPDRDAAISQDGVMKFCWWHLFTFDKLIVERIDLHAPDHVGNLIKWPVAAFE